MIGEREGRVPVTDADLERWAQDLDEDAGGAPTWEHEGFSGRVVRREPSNVEGVSFLIVVPIGRGPRS